MRYFTPLLLGILGLASLTGCTLLNGPTAPDPASFAKISPEQKFFFVLELEFDDRYDSYQRATYYQRFGAALEEVLKRHQYPGAVEIVHSRHKVPKDATIAHISIQSIHRPLEDYINVRFFAKLRNEGTSASLGPYSGEEDGLTLYRGEQARLRILQAAARHAFENFYADFIRFTTLGASDTQR